MYSMVSSNILFASCIWSNALGCFLALQRYAVQRKCWFSTRVYKIAHLVAVAVSLTDHALFDIAACRLLLLTSTRVKMTTN